MQKHFDLGTYCVFYAKLAFLLNSSESILVLFLLRT